MSLVEGVENRGRKIEESYFLLFGKGKIKVEEKWVLGVFLFGPKNLFLSPNWRKNMERKLKEMKCQNYSHFSIILLLMNDDLFICPSSLLYI